jgi:hypothetical protein
MGFERPPLFALNKKYMKNINFFEVTFSATNSAAEFSATVMAIASE